MQTDNTKIKTNMPSFNKACCFVTLMFGSFLQPALSHDVPVHAAITINAAEASTFIPFRRTNRRTSCAKLMDGFDGVTQGGPSGIGPTLGLVAKPLWGLEAGQLPIGWKFFRVITQGLYNLFELQRL